MRNGHDNYGWYLLCRLTSFTIETRSFGDGPYLGISLFLLSHDLLKIRHLQRLP